MIYIKIDEAVIKKRIDALEKYVEIFFYDGSCKKCLFINQLGYKIETTPYNFKGFTKETIFHKSNKYALENIKTWLLLTNRDYSLLDTNYINASYLMNWQCNSCGKILKKSLTNFKRYSYNCSCKNMVNLKELDIKELINNKNKNLELLKIDEKEVLIKCKIHKNIMRKSIKTILKEKYICKYCAIEERKKVPKNDSFFEKSPEKARFFKNIEESKSIAVSSNKEIECICPNCKNEFTQKASHLYRAISPCPLCSDKTSFGEKVMYNLLKLLNEDFKTQQRLGNSLRRYDFIVKDLVIEVNGLQHYADVPDSLGWIPLNQQRLIDNEKKKMALMEGYRFIEIDYKVSNFEYLKKSIINSLGKEFDLNNVDWDYVHRKSLKNNFMLTVNLYKEGMTTKQIAEHMKLSVGTIRNKICKAKKMNLCTSRSHSKFNDDTIIKKINLNGDVVKVYKGFKTVMNKEHFKYSTLYTALIKPNAISKGFRWEVDKYLSNKQEVIEQ